MYSNFYKLYAMVDSYLQVLGDDSELYCTNVSMHLVSHVDHYALS